MSSILLLRMKNISCEARFSTLGGAFWQFSETIPLYSDDIYVCTCCYIYLSAHGDRRKSYQ
jgi:hypothetical protein